jgi:hypothetical protein
MIRPFVERTLWLLIPLAAAGLGCNSGGSAPDTGSGGSGSAAHDHVHAGHEHADHDHADHAGGAADLAKVKEALAKLSPEDAAAASKQKMCPVSNELLGSMGPPVKVDAEGTAVWICCEGCRKPVEEDPAKFAAIVTAKSEP